MSNNEESIEKDAEKCYKPPSGSQKAFMDFFELMQKRRIDKVDVAFLSANKIAPGNEKKVVSGLKFLGLIKADGAVTEKLLALNVEGEPFKKALATVVQEAYKTLFATMKNIETAEAFEFTNCFKIDYGMAPLLAEQATRIFGYLARQAGITLSPTLMEEKQAPPAVSRLKKTESTVERKPVSGRQKIVVSPTGNGFIPIPVGMKRLEYENKVLLFLPEANDKVLRTQAAKLAKQLIEMYETECE